MGEHNQKVCGIKAENGMLALLLSILLGGLGTIIIGFMQKDEDCKKSAMIVGILQWLTSFIFVGYIWAIWTGFKIYKNSC